MLLKIIFYLYWVRYLIFLLWKNQYCGRCLSVKVKSRSKLYKLSCRLWLYDLTTRVQVARGWRYTRVGEASGSSPRSSPRRGLCPSVLPSVSCATDCDSQANSFLYNKPFVLIKDLLFYLSTVLALLFHNNITFVCEYNDELSSFIVYFHWGQSLARTPTNTYCTILYLTPLLLPYLSDDIVSPPTVRALTLTH